MYKAPVQEMEFLLNRVMNADRVTNTERFSDLDPDMFGAILGEAAKLCEDVIAPLNRLTDMEPAHLKDGQVVLPKGVKEALMAVSEGGWTGITASADYGGMGLPSFLATCVNEMMASASLSLSLYSLMAQGQIEALEAHASDELKALYLPKLISGEWAATMNLTEAVAGSDVGALRTKATPNGDGSYAITGQKIFITWGEHDVTDNIVHLVLARLPDGALGTKGISLFLVPKFILDENGEPQTRNKVQAISLEHKLGIHGSPTAVMEYEGATGWLVGETHRGMAAMFTMMNNARLGVGVEGVAVAEAATQKAIAYAAERKQGRVQGTGAIIEHPDVRRMVMHMKALTVAARAICYDTALSLDLGRSLEGEAALEFQARGAALTPIAKAFSTDIGIEVASLGIQVHGGMGFIEETGAAQYYRDARICSIYEGTNGIQAIDMVGRKMNDGGKAYSSLLSEIKTDASPELLEAVAQIEVVTNYLSKVDMSERLPAASHYLQAFGILLGAHYLAKAAAADAKREALSNFYNAQILPKVSALCTTIQNADEGLFDMSVEELLA